MLRRFLSDPDFRERVLHDPETEVENFDLSSDELASLRAVHERLDGLRDRHRHGFALGRLAAASGDDAGILFW